MSPIDKCMSRKEPLALPKVTTSYTLLRKHCYVPASTFARRGGGHVPPTTSKLKCLSRRRSLGSAKTNRKQEKGGSAAQSENTGVGSRGGTYGISRWVSTQRGTEQGH
eukprot:6203309-Pleurochrysis_carterae.AAC.3